MIFPFYDSKTVPANHYDGNLFVTNSPLCQRHKLTSKSTLWGLSVAYQPNCEPGYWPREKIRFLSTSSEIISPLCSEKERDSFGLLRSKVELQQLHRPSRSRPSLVFDRDIEPAVLARKHKSRILG